ncbi:MAG: hypothetical protein P8Y97_00340 [Candidatus Lokiarchaeota archaeon]
MIIKKKQIKFLSAIILGTVLVTLFALPDFSILSCAAPDPELPCGATYNWKERTFSFTFNDVWDNEVSIFNQSGVSRSSYTSENAYYDESNNYVKEEVTLQSVSNYSQYSKSVVDGSISMTYNFEVYEVALDYGKSLKMIWVAIKSGSIVLEYTINNVNRTYLYKSDTTLTRTEKVDKYSDGSMNSLIDSSQNEITFNDSSNYEENFYTENEYSKNEATFSMPVILICQMVTTKTGEKMAWAELFGDFIVYNDTNFDNIYSAGDSSSSTQMSLSASDENCGTLYPMVGTQTSYLEHPSMNMSYTQNLPSDLSVDDYVNTIEFTPPTQGNNNNISWGIEYPDIPLNGFIENGEDFYYLPPNATLSEVATSDISYGFNYEITPSFAAMDYTFSFDKVSELLYSAVQGLSLATPHYTYLLSNFDIEQTEESFLSAPKDSFEFITNGTKIAEIDFAHPVKKNYDLYDYPSLGKVSTYNAIGASVNLLISKTCSYATPLSGGNVLQNLIYSLDDVVALDPKFTVNDNLFSMETQNYPYWSGNKIIHDPTLKVLYSGESEPEQEEPDDTPTNPNEPESIPSSSLSFFKFIFHVFIQEAFLF